VREGDLAGCDVDADAMANLLVSGFGFAAGNVFVLKDKNATRANIAGALVELGKRAGPHDAVLFYYSGHGAQIPDLDGDEEDGWDEAIVPCDPKPARIATEEEMGVFLSDDAMREIFDAYKTKNVTMIFDSCHSGDAIRDATEEAPAEFVQERADRTQWGRELMRQRDDAMEAAGRKRKGDAELDLDTEYVFLSACQSWETAAGSPQGGIFTSVLAPLLLQAQGESWGEIFARARLYVPMRNPGQTPAAMGALRRYPFSLAEAEKDAPYVRPTIAAMGAVEAKRAPNAVAPRLNDGTAGTHEALLSGLASLYAEQIGTTYDVYPRADAGLAGKPTARAADRQHRFERGARQGRPPAEPVVLSDRAYRKRRDPVRRPAASAHRPPSGRAPARRPLLQSEVGRRERSEGRGAGQQAAHGVRRRSERPAREVRRPRRLRLRHPAGVAGR
jgi:hypothetical protein